MESINSRETDCVGVMDVCFDSSRAVNDHFFVFNHDGQFSRLEKSDLNSRNDIRNIDQTPLCVLSVAWRNNTIMLGCRKKGITKPFDYFLYEASNTRISDPWKLIEEFQTEIKTIDISDTQVAVGCEEDFLTLFDISTKKTRKYYIDSKPCYLKFDPNNKFLAVTMLSGNHKIICLENERQSYEFEDMFPYVSSYGVSQSRNSIVWSADGKVVYFPHESKIAGYSLDNDDSGSWVETVTFEYSSFNLAKCDRFSTIAISSCQKYLAGGFNNDKFVIWSVDSRDVILESKLNNRKGGSNDSPLISALDFSPSSGELLVFDNSGCITTFKVDNFENEDCLIKEDDSLEDEMDDDNDIGRIKRQYGFDSNGEIEQTRNNVPDNYKLRQVDYQKEHQNSNRSELTYTAPRGMLPSRFINCSCPETYSQRFLKFNQYGTIRSYEDRVSKIKAIEAEFHEANTHSVIIIDNLEKNYQLADISPKAIIVGTESKTSEIGEIQVVPINSFDEKRWSFTMPENEGIIDVLSSEKQVAVITESRTIRVFTICGIQRHVFSHPSHILTATCFDHFIAIVSASGPEFYDPSYSSTKPQWQFRVHEYNINQTEWYGSCQSETNGKLCKTFDLPVSPCETLKWISYSNTGQLSIMDSRYTVNVLTTPGLWFPIFHGQSLLRSMSDGIFPVSVVERREKDGISRQFRYINCRGTKHPLLNMVNPIVVSSWKLPLCDRDNARTAVEEDLIFSELSIVDGIVRNGSATTKQNKMHLAAITKLFASFLSNFGDNRAVELATFVKSAKGIQLLVNYANNYKRTSVADKISEIGQKAQFKLDGTLSSCRETVEHADSDDIRPVAIRKSKKRDFVEDVENFSYTGEKMSTDADSTKLAKVDKDGMEVEEDTSMRLPDSQSTNDISQFPISPRNKPSVNPFKIDRPKEKKNVSVLEELNRQPESKTDFKDAAKNIKITGPPKKQSKLGFSSSTSKCNEARQNVSDIIDDTKCVDATKKTMSFYEYWLQFSTEHLQDEYGQVDDGFTKHCIQAFRKLSKEDKDKWKSRYELEKSNDN